MTKPSIPGHRPKTDHQKETRPAVKKRAAAGVSAIPYGHIAGTMPRVVAYIDHGLVFRSAGPPCPESFPFSAEDPAGKEIRDVIGDRNFLKSEPFIQCALKGEVVRFVEDFELPSEAAILVDGTLIPDTAPDGTVRGFHSVLTDISILRETGRPGPGRSANERQQADAEKARLEAQLQQARKMEVIGTLAGGIAHDFNNILGAMIGYTQLTLMDMEPEDPNRRNLNKILQAGTRARDLVKQILTFSRQSEQNQTPQKISPVIKEVIRFIRSSLPSTIEIRQDIRAEKATIMANTTQIHQVLMNLCTNAAHAMKSHGGELRIELYEISPQDARDGEIKQPDAPFGFLCLAVNDTGAGMTPQTMERIFDPYFTTKEPGEGTGMGLAVVLGIVKSHKGDIRVSSTPGKGSRFEIYFPLSEASVPASTIGPESDLPGGDERILFVDDESSLTDVGFSLLEKIGYKVTCLTSSTRAIEVFKKTPDDFDLIITDQTMPHITGLELAEQVRAIRPDIPVILCTGFNQLESEQKAKDIGIGHILMKPIGFRDLAKTVRELLDGRNSPAHLN